VKWWEALDPYGLIDIKAAAAVLARALEESERVASVSGVDEAEGDKEVDGSGTPPKGD
jgi:hypothetical protein